MFKIWGNKRLMFRAYAFAIIVLMAAGVSACRDTNNMADSYLEGKGTIDNPYRVKSVDDLEWLSIQVNTGTEFADVYFQQENDLDFSDYGNWVPIGAFGSGYCFRGVYDGQGHSIQNITIDGNELPGVDVKRMNVGLFGVLAGTVCNLKIESGTITGNCIGSIASHGTDEAVIANCYNQASLTALGRCGGIADNFHKGKIIACANAGTLTCNYPQWIGGISSYAAGVIYSCYSTISPVPEGFEGQMYHTDQVKEVYPGIADGDLEQTQKVFADDLDGLALLNFETGTDMEQNDN